MPIITKWSETGVTWTYKGSISAKEMIACFQQYYADPRFSYPHFQLNDFLGVDEFKLSVGDAKTIADMDIEACQQNPNIFVALVSDTAFISALTSFYSNEMDHRSRWESKLFTTLEAAQEWIDNSEHQNVHIPDLASEPKSAHNRTTDQHEHAQA